ncbi:hypothetical protein D3C76_1749200 [compost metagenome]
MSVTIKFVNKDGEPLFSNSETTSGMPVDDLYKYMGIGDEMILLDGSHYKVDRKQFHQSSSGYEGYFYFVHA